MDRAGLAVTSDEMSPDATEPTGADRTVGSTGHLRSVDPDRYPDWEAIYLDNVERLYRIMYSRVGNRADAEDLTAEVFRTALGPLRASASIGEVRAYLLATSRTVLAGHWKRRFGLEVTTIDVATDLALLDQPPAESDAPQRVKQNPRSSSGTVRPYPRTAFPAILLASRGSSCDEHQHRKRQSAATPRPPPSGAARGGMVMSRRRFSAFVDALLANRRPRRFEPRSGRRRGHARRDRAPGGTARRDPS